MRPIDADALINEIKKETEKAIERDDKVDSFWLGYIAGLVIKQPTIQPVVTDTNVGDTISRQAAIDGKIIIQRTNGVEIYYDEAVPVGYLKRLPSVQPEPQWIPCSERMPKTGVEVLTYDEALNYIEIQTFSDGRWENQRGDWQDPDDIAAWMPLPKPFEGGTE